MATTDVFELRIPWGIARKFALTPDTPVNCGVLVNDYDGWFALSSSSEFLIMQIKGNMRRNGNHELCVIATKPADGTLLPHVSAKHADMQPFERDFHAMNPMRCGDAYGVSSHLDHPTNLAEINENPCDYSMEPSLIDTFKSLHEEKLISDSSALHHLSNVPPTDWKETRDESVLSGERTFPELDTASDECCLICGFFLEPGSDTNNLKYHCETFHNLTASQYLDLQSIREDANRTCMQEAVTEYMCETCGEVSMTPSDYAAHVQNAHLDKVHSNAPEELLKCPVCTETFSSKESVVSHFKSSHKNCLDYQAHFKRFLGQSLESTPDESTPSGGSKLYPCVFCDKNFKYRMSLSRHRPKCAKNPHQKKVYLCTQCYGCHTTDKAKYDEHMAKHSLDAGGFVCETCGFKCSKVQTLTKHRQMKHGLKKKTWHQCKLCSKKFYAPCLLKLHEERHANKRQHICDQCGKRFKTAKDLHVHIEHVHLNKYPYHCKKCGHGMAKKMYLRKHRCDRVKRNQYNLPPENLPDDLESHGPPDS